ncbi:MAG: class I SAM-dependent methyltransferase [Candidatus Omnitrophica bacterium]|nr:class I SAM-dependent methyltransferase [Candidatus Omnitrophota bacterium]
MRITHPEKRLFRFYGEVVAAQNREIIRLITGKRILEVGSGYGALIHQIKTEKTDVENITGIEIDPDSIDIAKKLYNIDIMHSSVYQMDFEDNAFDTVILRHVVHHLNEDGNLKGALEEIKRVCSRELIIFDPNPTWLLRFCRKMIRHVDPEASLDYVIDALQRSGFEVASYTWRDVLAFPLSGGFVGAELVPNHAGIENAILRFDTFLNTVLLKLRLQKYFCWRYLIYATKCGCHAAGAFAGKQEVGAL